MASGRDRLGRPVSGWLRGSSLDRSDSDPASFWAYAIAALRTVAPGIGDSALAQLHALQRPPIETVLTALLNDLAAITADIVLVLDDYHVIDAREVQDGMAFLLDHLPPRLHVVIASRADPALPLARLRARGELVEIRAADLRFTPDEAAAYLNEMMGLQLAAPDVAALERRTEGWIAALQLAALSMQGRADIAGFIAGFAGDDRYVVDYLFEEVLQRQPDDVQAFLLQTSILDGLSGPLCDAVTGHGGGKAMLEALDRGNLFLVPLDDRRQWYRYHHLFADVLRRGCWTSSPARCWTCTGGRACGTSAAATSPRPSATRWPPGTSSEQQTWSSWRSRLMARNRQEATVRGWLEMIPSELVRVRPVLSALFAGVLLLHGELEGVEDRLRDAERWLDPAAATGEGPQSWPSPMVVADEEEFRRLPGTIEMYRAAQALARGDSPGTVRHARRALELAPEDDHLRRAGASGLMGLAFWGNGDLEAAHRAYSECAAGLRRAGYVADILGCAIALADIRIAQGRLGEAVRTYEQALQLVSEQGGAGSAGNSRHARRDERALPRARRSGGRHPAPGDVPGARRAHRTAAAPVSLAGRDGPGTAG